MSRNQVYPSLLSLWMLTASRCRRESADQAGRRRTVSCLTAKGEKLQEHKKLPKPSERMAGSRRLPQAGQKHSGPLSREKWGILQNRKRENIPSASGQRLKRCCHLSKAKMLTGQVQVQLAVMRISVRLERRDPRGRDHQIILPRNP